jgi:hypothetical protein
MDAKLAVRNGSTSAQSSSRRFAESSYSFFRQQAQCRKSDPIRNRQFCIWFAPSATGKLHRTDRKTGKTVFIRNGTEYPVESDEKSKQSSKPESPSERAIRLAKRASK